jgi:hypothetical protein
VENLSGTAFDAAGAVKLEIPMGFIFSVRLCHFENMKRPSWVNLSQKPGLADMTDLNVPRHPWPLLLTDPLGQVTFE